MWLKSASSNKGAVIFGYYVSDPTAYGVVEFDKNGNALGIEENITSPTFNIIKEYTSGEMDLYHMDVYRLEGDTSDLGLEEYLKKDGVIIIEWADMIESELPEERLEIKFKITGEEKRTLTITPYGSKYEDLCEDVL